MNPAQPEGAGRSDWYMLEPARLAVHLIGKNPEQIAAWVVGLADALATKRRGIHTFADELMVERERYIQTRRECGLMRKRRGQPLGDLGSSTGDLGSSTGDLGSSGGDPRQNRTGTEQDIYPEKKTVSDSVKISILKQPEQPHGKETAFLHPEPWVLAAVVCREEHQPKTLNTFRKRWRELGDKAFREELHTFMAELEEREEPPNRGAALNKRLTGMVVGAKARKLIRVSLDSVKERPA